jgi:hypothetical protein
MLQQAAAPPCRDLERNFFMQVMNETRVAGAVV